MKLLSAYIIIFLMIPKLFAQDTGILIRKSEADVNGIVNHTYWYLEKNNDSTIREFEKFSFGNENYKVYPFFIAPTIMDLFLACEYCNFERRVDKLDSLLKAEKIKLKEYEILYYKFINRYGDGRYDIFFKKGKDLKVKDDSVEYTFSKIKLKFCKCSVFIGFSIDFTNVYAIPNRLFSVKKITRKEKRFLNQNISQLTLNKMVNGSEQ